MAKVLERSLYKEDYYAWTKQQAAELRRLAAARIESPLDLENLAEEVESLGQSDLNTVRSQVRRTSSTSSSSSIRPLPIRGCSGGAR
jgi:hypothetical protein